MSGSSESAALHRNLWPCRQWKKAPRHCWQLKNCHARMRPFFELRCHDWMRPFWVGMFACTWAWKLIQEVERVGKSSFTSAHYIDRQKKGKERGVTISRAPPRSCIPTSGTPLIDVSGHRHFIKNIIIEALQADVALIMDPADSANGLQFPSVRWIICMPRKRRDWGKWAKLARLQREELYVF